MEKTKKIEKIKHALAHILAMAVLDKYKKAKITIGPAIKNGFYYDIDFGDKKIKENELKDLEKIMKKICSKNLDFKREEVSFEEALEKVKGNEYKIELINELKDSGEKISFYKIGDNFEDLCGGPHIENTSEIKYNAFKLTKIAGAYWRGDEKKKMLTRIYGIAFETKYELVEYENFLREAEKRDHRKIGKEFGLYTILPEVGAGLVLWKPKGAVILNVLKNWFEQEQLKKDYMPVITPHIGKKSLWITSGHWNFYNDSMYPPIELGQTLEDYQDNRKPKDSETYLLKPMNCPFHIMIYNDDLYSYKDLPLKYYEFGTVYRYEQTGELGGLTRVRGFTQDDAHIICTKEQLKDEMKKVVDFAFYVLKDVFNFEVEVKASFRNTNSEKQMGNHTDWNLSEKTILEVLNEKKINYDLDIGGAAFYGPKIDIKVKDSIGRLWQLSTIQFDFNLSERFNMKFKNKDGKDERPFVIHRALLGSLERFMGVLIEHYAGAFPFWLAPEQIRIIPVGDFVNNYAENIYIKLKDNNFRIKLENSKDSFGKKIRKAKKDKLPYFIIIGENDKKENKLTLESIEGNSLQLSFDELLVKLKKEKK